MGGTKTGSLSEFRVTKDNKTPPSHTTLITENCDFTDNGKKFDFEIYDSTGRFVSNRLQAKVSTRLVGISSWI